ncbi:hypothetical protein A4G16_06285 [Mannheimia granulomatis]|uniref:AAA domain-containing protein n=1 Tax=Mannheimia granulomatis TaxID=85402 RepID=A0A6G8JIJ9_9PAST|nr:AAA family ATPase [Mannheimia granulomatis]QIM67005.1 hypothetical protein A4G16_06285 [Mannheimia granulomatis]
MINRPNYHQQLKPFINTPLIKVITGIRRSDKLTVMKLLRAELLSQGVAEAQIIHINFESFAFMVDLNLARYITGANSYLLSTKLSTYLAGRYVEIPIFTLSFNEFLAFKANHSAEKTQNPTTLFNEYLRKGGFPMVHTGNYELETAYKIVQDIYTLVILRDTVQRHKIRDVEVKYHFLFGMETNWQN